MTIDAETLELDRHLAAEQALSTRITELTTERDHWKAIARLWEARAKRHNRKDEQNDRPHPATR